MKTPAFPSPSHLRDPKRRGEWVEMKFMAEAAARGLTLLKPYGESSRYDFVVTSARDYHRVQVKSAFARHHYAYRCVCVTGTNCRPYTARDIDFFAIYIGPADAWYIIPARAVGRKHSLALFPQRRQRSASRYEKYRDAWHLLTET